jgi:hypothetical protein
MTEHAPGQRSNELLLDGAASELTRTIAIEGFHALWRGERIHASTLDPDRADADVLASQGRLELDPDGLIIGVHGLVARETPHRIEHANGTVHTWCALDAIGIPAAMAIDATAVTSCPTCSTELRVSIPTGQPVEDSRLVLWLPTGPCTHLVEDFCRNANLYCNHDHLAATIPPDLVGEPISITEAAAIGRSAWSDIAPST